MSPDRAISIAENKLRMKYTGIGYEYDGDFYLEMAPLDYNPKEDGRIIDSCYKVDAVTAKVSLYSPVLHGIQDIRKIHYLT